jgi:Flp pilus assembly protein TadG
MVSETRVVLRRRTPVICRSMMAAAGRLGESGSALVEFAIVAPVLLLIIIGAAQFGIALNQYVMLWNGVGVGAMQFAISGGASSTPASNAWTALTQNAPTLTTGGSCGAAGTSLCMTLTVNGTACLTNANKLSAAQAADSTCNSALNSNVATPAVVTATYPCNLNVMQYNFFPSCLLTAQITELVE